MTPIPCQITHAPVYAIAAILNNTPKNSLFTVSDSMADYELEMCGLDAVPEHHRDVDRGGPLHHSFTCMQEVVLGEDAVGGYIYTVLNLEGGIAKVYYSMMFR